MAMTVGELVAYLKLDDGQFNKGLDQAHSKMGQAGTKLGQAGARIGGAIGTAVKRGAVVAGAAITGLVGTALVKGFQRLTAIENATSTLKGLGHSAAEVQIIMDNALASVKGTAFGLDEAATVAASAVASGIKPGQQLEETLRLVADAATIGKTSIGEMGAVFNKVAASNKMQGDVMAQLNDMGIPIQQFLAKSLDVTIDKVYELSKAGTISFPMFAKAMKEGLGGAAIESGNTTIGAWKNMLAALSRLGASALSGIFPSFKVAFSKIGVYLDDLETKYGAVFKKWGKGVSAAFKTGGFTGMFKAMLPEGVGGDLIDTFTTIKDVVIDIAGALGGISKDSLAIAGDVLSIVSQLTTPIGKAFVGLPDSIKKFIVAAGLLAIALNKFGLLGGAKGLLGGLLGKGGGAATEVPLTTAVGLNTAATEANTLALMGKGGLPTPGTPTANPLGPAGPAAGGGLLSKIKGPFSWMGLAGMAGMSVGGAGVEVQTLPPEMAAQFHAEGEKAGNAFAGGISTRGKDIARSLRASGDKAGAGLAAGLARGVGPALQSIQKVHNAAGRPIRMGHLDATQMINEIARLAGAFGDVRSAARTAGNAAANAIKSPSGGGGSYRGHFMAAGGDFMVNRPTVFIAGEAGRERATFTPVGKEPPGTAGTTTVVHNHFNLHVGQLVGTDERAARQLWNTVKPIAMSEMRLKGAMSRG